MFFLISFLAFLPFWDILATFSFLMCCVEKSFVNYLHLCSFQKVYFQEGLKRYIPQPNVISENCQFSKFICIFLDQNLNLSDLEIYVLKISSKNLHIIITLSLCASQEGALQCKQVGDTTEDTTEEDTPVSSTNANPE